MDCWVVVRSDNNVSDGDIGFVRAIDRDLGDVTVEFDGRPVLCGAHELDEVVLAYATNVHKARGCERSAVVIPVTTQHHPMLGNLIHTGITRGRKLVVLVRRRPRGQRVPAGVGAPAPRIATVV